MVPVEELFAVLGRHFATTVLQHINKSDGSSVEAIERELDNLLKITRAAIVDEFARDRARKAR